MRNLEHATYLTRPRALFGQIHYLLSHWHWQRPAVYKHAAQLIASALSVPQHLRCGNLMVLVVMMGCWRQNLLLLFLQLASILLIMLNCGCLLLLLVQVLLVLRVHLIHCGCCCCVTVSMLAAYNRLLL